MLLVTRVFYKQIFPKELVLLFSNRKELLIRYSKNLRFLTYDVLVRNVFFRNVAMVAFGVASSSLLHATSGRE